MNHVAELPLQSLKDLAVVRAIVYALAGIILWDFFSTLRFDIDFVRGKTSRSWPLIVYFWARYSSLLFVGAVVPQAGASFRIKCEGVWVTLLLATTFQVSCSGPRYANASARHCSSSAPAPYGSGTPAW
ncbi:unnamed protein product [Parajaminaea phylloscopi]